MSYPTDKNGEGCSAFHTGRDDDHLPRHDDGTRAGKITDAPPSARDKVIAEEQAKRKEQVDHPAHYGGADSPYEVVKVAEAWGLDRDAYLFNTLKYIGRAGKKSDAVLTDLKKARWYLDRRIANMEKGR